MSRGLDKNLGSAHRLASLMYLQKLIKRRRVLMVGDDMGTARFLLDARARKVCCVLEEEPKPGSGGHKWRDIKGLELEISPPEELSFRSGAFDVALVADIRDLPEPFAALQELGRVVGRRGVVVVAVPNPSCKSRFVALEGRDEDVDYYESYDMLQELFPSVQMIGQSPFAGYAVADLGYEDEELPVTFDATLMDGDSEEIEWFLAVCSERAVALDPYSVIQLPLSSLPLSEGGDLEPAEGDAERLAALEEELKVARRELGNRGVRIESLEKDLENELLQSEAARARAVDLAKELDNERKATQKRQLESEYAKRTRGLEGEDRREVNAAVRQAEQRASAAEQARDQLLEMARRDAAELDKIRTRYEKLEEKRSAWSDEKKKHETTVADLRAKLEEAETKVAKAPAPVDPGVQARVRELNLQLKQAEQRAQSAEMLRDELVNQTRLDASEFENLRKAKEQLEDKASKSKQRVEELEKVVALMQRDIASRAVPEQEVVQKQSKKTPEAPPRKAPPAEQKGAQDEEVLSRECARLEEGVKELSGKNRQLSEELARRESLIRDLVIRLESFGPALVESSQAPSPRIEELEMENAALRGTSSGHHRARVEAELSLSALEVEHKKLQYELAQSRITIEELESEVQKQERTIADKETEIERVLHEVARLNQIKERLEAEAEELSIKQGEMLAEIGGKSRDKKGAESPSEIIQRDQRIADLESELQAARWTISELDARHRKSSPPGALGQGEGSQIVRERDEALARLSTLEQELERVRGNETRVAAQMSAAERGARMLEEEFDSRRARIGDLESALKAAQDRIRELVESLEQANASRATLEKEMSAAQELSGLAQRDKAEAERRADAESKRITELDSELEMARVELDGAREKVSQIEQRASNLEIDVRHELAAQIMDQSGAEVLDQLKGDLEQVRRELREKERQADESRMEVERLRDLLQNESQWTHQAGADAARLSGDLDALKAQINEREAELDEAVAAHEAFERVVCELRCELSAIWDRPSAKEDPAQPPTTTPEGPGSRGGGPGAEALEKEVLHRREWAAYHVRELSRANDRVDGLRRELEEVMGREARVFDDLEATKKELSAAQERLVAVGEARVDASEELSAAMEQKELLERRVRDKETEAAHAKQASQQASQRVGQLEGELEVLREKASKALGGGSSAEQAQRIGAEVEDTQALMASLTEQLEEREKRAMRLERELGDLRAELQEHDGDVAQWQMELHSRNNRIVELEKELRSLQSRFS